MANNVIVISGMGCAGSTTIAEKLAERLGLRFFSVGRYFKQKAPGFGMEKETKSSARFLASHEGGNKEFHLNLDELQRELARKGSIVIDSKLGIFMLKGLSDFSVWLKSDIGVRAKRVSGRDSITEEEALDILKEKERVEQETFKRIYGFDYLSAEKKADLVIETSGKTPEEIVDEIVKEIEKRRLLKRK
jgi:predicted cytidylate kinase